MCSSCEASGEPLFSGRAVGWNLLNRLVNLFGSVKPIVLVLTAPLASGYSRIAGYLSVFDGGRNFSITQTSRSTLRSSMATRRPSGYTRTP
jgi:hypothetical protein